MKPRWVVKPLTPEAVYTGRTDVLEYLHHAALEAAHRRTMSTVLLGKRRMGKTEIFKRVVNRLFFEQDPRDPQAVVPVYYTFPDTSQDERSFAKDYLENFMRYYIGFYTRQPHFITDLPKEDELLSRIDDARHLYPFRRTPPLAQSSNCPGFRHQTQNPLLHVQRRVPLYDDVCVDSVGVLSATRLR